MRPLTILLMLLALLHTGSARARYEGLQCVPYARAVTGIDIRGDAHSWWDQAAGRYNRGQQPQVGAVMSFRPHGIMRLGHIAAVRKIIDRRTVMVSHANWSAIDGQRGHIEENIRVVDASADNDWSVVQVWYTPNGALGTTLWPLNGFIYPAQKRSDAEARLAVAQIIGSAAQDAKATQYAAISRSAPAAASFRLSAKTLADINRAADGETRVAVVPAVAAKRRAKADASGDLTGAGGR